MGQGRQESFDLPEGTPEFYVDSVNIQTHLYGSTLLLGELRSDAPALVKVIVKVSPPMAKVLSLILSKHVREYEGEVGPIPIPKKLLHSLGLEELI